MLYDRLIGGVRYTKEVLRGLVADGILPPPVSDGADGPQWEQSVAGGILSGLIRNDEAALRALTDMVKARRLMGDSMEVVADNAGIIRHPDFAQLRDGRLAAESRAQAAVDRAEAHAGALGEKGGNRKRAYDSFLHHNMAEAGSRS
jgi:hypothetical protein